MEEDRRNNTKSVEAKVLVLSRWSIRNWMGRAVDYYVESERDPTNRYARTQPTPEDFALMQQEAVDAIGQLDFQDRQ